MDPDALISEAVQTISGRDFDRAQHLLEDSLSIRPDHAAGIVSLAVVHFLKKDFARSEALFRDALEQDRHAVPAALGLAKLLLVQQRQDEARQTLEGIELDVAGPDRAEFDLLTGIIHAGSREWERAIEAFERYAEAAPKKVDPWVCLHKAYVGQGDAASAIRMLEEVAERAPDQPTIWIRLVAMCREIGDTARLLSTCGAMLNAMPDNLVLHNLAAHLAIESGCYAYAYRYYQRALRIAPQLDTTAFAALSRIAAVVP